MADFGTVLSVAQTLFAAEECSFLRRVFSAIEYKSDLQGLKQTMKTVNSVLRDLGNKTEFSETESDYIQNFRDAVYDADDLFDEFLTLAELKHQRKYAKLSEKVREFFSSRNPLIVAYLMSRDIKTIRKKLNDIADDRVKFGFRIETPPHKRRMEETHSLVYAYDVVGREDDASNVINRLLDSTRDVISFLTIVGVGGLGKTTLAKLVFGDQRIQSQFALRLWACVSDQDVGPLCSKQVLLKILESVNCKLGSEISIEYVKDEFQRRVKGKKFLLVLDDIWTESSLEWQDLRKFLMIGGRGSRIIATTRSRETANVIGEDTYELEGLSKENSRRLFRLSAFREGPQPSNFVEVGEKIVEKCANVPLAIKVVGNLLYGKPVDKWRVFEASGLVGISNGKNEIMSILKYSYDHLEPSLKVCFAYCALFPKGYVINKEMLLNLWEAQGYVVPFDRGQSIENACEEHFSILLQRCFFQDIKKDEFGDVESFRMHDLMHDLAQRVSGNDTHVILDSRARSVGASVRHLFDARGCLDNHLLITDSNKIRSYLLLGPHNYKPFPLSQIGNNNVVSLRALALNRFSINVLPHRIGNLLHLRYLNLADNDIIQHLPESVAKLHNLRILNLSRCYALRKLPKHINNLVNLTHLHLDRCNSLTWMPKHMSELSHLRVLTDFMVCNENTRWREHAGRLEDLKALVVNLQGHIAVHFDENYSIEDENKSEGSWLNGGDHLKTVKFCFSRNCNRQNDERGAQDEAVMKNLQPHSGLKKFKLEFYKGETISGWGRAQDNWAIFLPNLVYIELRECKRLQQLPLLSKLLYLKSLRLNGLEKLEYVEDDVQPSSGSHNHDFTFFPSLESLEIRGLDKLKRWFESGSSSNIHDETVFRRLSQLTIIKCPDLTTFPPCPSLQTLNLEANNEALRITSGQLHTSPLSDSADKLSLFAQTDNMDHLKSLSPQLLTGLYTSNNSKMQHLREAEEVFRNCSSSLHNLEIQQCNKLTSVSGGFEHLTALTSLTLEGCKELSFEGRGNNDTNDMPWIGGKGKTRCRKKLELNYQINNL